MGVITQGLAQVQIGTASTSGTMPGSLTKIGAVYKDSCKLTQDTASVVEHFEEGQSAPLFQNEDLKMPSLAFQLMDADVDLLALAIGGSVTSGVWGFDGTVKNSNKAVKVVTKQGLVFDIPNGRIRATLNAEFSEKGINLLDVVVTPLAVTSGYPLMAYTTTPLTVSSNALTFTSSLDSTGQTVTATSTGNLTLASIPSGQDWLTVTYTGKVATVKVLANANTAPRSTVMTMIADGKTASVTITQAGA